MIDHFALLGEARRPWLAVEALRGRFLALSAQAHPDRMHGAGAAERAAANQRFATLNQAYNCLREPRERLMHLLELERGAKPADVQRLPPGTMDLFMEVGQLCRLVDAFLSERSKVTTPILRVRLFTQAIEWSEKLRGVLAKVSAQQEELLGELLRLNAAWEQAPEGDAATRRATLPLNELERFYRRLSYLARWAGQLQERIVQLAAGG